MYTKDSKTCSKCQYRSPLGNNGSYLDSDTYCNYIGWTGKMRGCAGGDGYEKFKPKTGHFKLRPMKEAIMPHDYLANGKKPLSDAGTPENGKENITTDMLPRR